MYKPGIIKMIFLGFWSIFLPKVTSLVGTPLISWNVRSIFVFCYRVQTSKLWRFCLHYGFFSIRKFWNLAHATLHEYGNFPFNVLGIPWGYPCNRFRYFSVGCFLSLLKMGNLLGTSCFKGKTESDFKFTSWNNWLNHDVQSVEEVILGPNILCDKMSCIRPHFHTWTRFKIIMVVFNPFLRVLLFY